MQIVKISRQAVLQAVFQAIDQADSCVNDCMSQCSSWKCHTEDVLIEKLMRRCKCKHAKIMIVSSSNMFEVEDISAAVCQMSM